MNKIVLGFIYFFSGLVGLLSLNYIISDSLVQSATDGVFSSFLGIWIIWGVFLAVLILGVLFIDGFYTGVLGMLFLAIAYLVGSLTPLGDWALWIMIIPFVYLIVRGINNFKEQK